MPSLVESVELPNHGCSTPLVSSYILQLRPCCVAPVSPSISSVAHLLYKFTLSHLLNLFHSLSQIYPQHLAYFVRSPIIVIIYSSTREANMSSQPLHHFTRRNLQLDSTFNPPIDPVDGISDSEENGNHYSRIRELRHPHGPGSENRAAKKAYHEDERETVRREQAYENKLIDEVLRVRGRHRQKQLRLLNKDGLDKRAYQTLLPLSRDVERTQERLVA
jgi:hypothetical protein